MKRILEKIINSGDLLYEELYYVSLGEELGILRALGSAANSYKKAIVDAGPLVQEALEQAFKAGAATGLDTPLPSTAKVFDLRDIQKEKISADKLADVIKNSTIDQPPLNLAVGTKTILIESTPSAKELIKEIQQNPDVYQDSPNVKKIYEKYKTAVPFVSPIEKNLKIETLIKKYENVPISPLTPGEQEYFDSSEKQKYASIAGSTGRRELNIVNPVEYENIPMSPPTPWEQEFLDELEQEREHEKHIPEKTGAKRATSTPELSEVTKKILKKYGTPSPFTNEERQRFEKIKEQFDKDNKKKAKKSTARKLQFSGDDEPKEEPKPAKIPQKIKLPTKGEKGLYKATLKDTSPNTKDIEFEFDEWRDVDKYLRKFEGTETNRYLRSGVITQGKVSDSIKFGTGFYIDFSKAEYMPIKDGSRLSKNLTIDDSKSSKRANIEFRLNK